MNNPLEEWWKLRLLLEKIRIAESGNIKMLYSKKHGITQTWSHAESESDWSLLSMCLFTYNHVDGFTLKVKPFVVLIWFSWLLIFLVTYQERERGQGQAEQSLKTEGISCFGNRIHGSECNRSSSWDPRLCPLLTVKNIHEAFSSAVVCEHPGLTWMKERRNPGKCKRRN